MGNLGDALQKAGLISEQELRRSGRGQSRSKPRGGQRRGGAAGSPGVLAQKAAQARARSNAVARREAGQLSPDRLRAVELLHDHEVLETGGRIRWHFVNSRGRIPYLLVTQQVQRQLSSGAMILARDGQRTLVIPQETGEVVAGLCPELLSWR